MNPKNTTVYTKLIMQFLAFLFGVSLVLAGAKWDVVQAWGLSDNIKTEMKSRRNHRERLISAIERRGGNNFEVMKAFDSFKNNSDIEILGNSASLQVVLIVAGILMVLLAFSDSVTMILSARKNGKATR